MNESSQSLPSKIYITHVSCHKKEVRLIVEEWVQREARSRGWYWFQKFGDGYLIEAHIDGPGKSYLSAMLEKDQADGIVPSVNNDVVIELGRSSIHTLVIDHDEAYVAKPDYLSASKQMRQAILDPSPYLLTSALICFLISVSALMISVSARPPIEPIVIPDVPTQKTPTQWWDEHAHWSRTERPVQISLDRTGKWTLTTEEASNGR